uniref:MRN complex-interacting protein n=1 Tax=Phallusia mammillata TaxID=59560 RepID=A0A6F9DL88_9ASCI|nr:MRN complex-interacting protein [Phallusia mammillata]
MPQQFCSLRCYECKIFQVHLTSKSKKWSCKICKRKQSYQKIYFEGSGANCRQHVQKANMLRAEIDEHNLMCGSSTKHKSPKLESERANEPGALSASKWAMFVADSTPKNSDSGDNELTQTQPTQTGKLKDNQPSIKSKTVFSQKNNQSSNKENSVYKQTASLLTRKRFHEHVDGGSNASRWLAYAVSSSSSE